jgi:hypothetical protein
MSGCHKCLKKPGLRNPATTTRYALVDDISLVATPELISGSMKYDSIGDARRDKIKYPGFRVVTIVEHRLV